MAPLRSYFFLLLLLLPLFIVSCVVAHNVDACKHLICCNKDDPGAAAGAGGGGGDKAAAAGGGGGDKAAAAGGGGAGDKAAAAGAGDQGGGGGGGGGGGDCSGGDKGAAGGGNDKGGSGSGGGGGGGGDKGAASAGGDKGGGGGDKGGGGGDKGAAGAGGDKGGGGGDKGAAAAGGDKGGGGGDKGGGGGDKGAAAAGGDKGGGGGDKGAAAAGGDKGGGGGDKGAAAAGGDKGGGGRDKGAAAAGGDKGGGGGDKGGGGGDKGGGGGGGDKGGGGGGGKDKGGGGGGGGDKGKDKGGGGGKDKGGGGGKDKGGGGGKDKGGGGGGKGGFYDPPLYGQAIKDSNYKGEWVIHNPNVGVSAMQYQLMPNNKAVWYDTTNLGPSARELGPKGNCPPNPDNNNEPDCFAHGLQYDIESGEVVSVYVKTDPWCSSGHLLPNGDLLSTGGNKMGFQSVRLLSINDPEPKFVERQGALGAPRWYPSNLVLEDGGAIVVGGRDSYSYDLIPPRFDFQTTMINFPFLQQTTEPSPIPGQYVENNLYPFLFLLPDGNVFIFANDRAIAFNPKTGQTVKEYPVLEGGSRNYPPSGQSALFPLRLSPDNAKPVNVEVVVCGGNRRDALPLTDNKFTQTPMFPPANADCNRIKPLAPNPAWEKEQDMPSPRTMGDILQLPNTQFLLINGAKAGCSGWNDGVDPNLTPTVYMPEKEPGKRFKELNPTTIPRMYHSVSSVLPDGKILVAGSNAHQFYTFDGPYPTELRTEKFSPHYLDPGLKKDRPVIKEEATDKILKYGKKFKVTFTLESNPNAGNGDVLLTLLYPPFTTHGFSQNQRMLIVGVESVNKNVIAAVAPPSGKLAPPGYYLMFVVYLNVPSRGVWVHID